MNRKFLLSDCKNTKLLRILTVYLIMLITVTSFFFAFSMIPLKNNYKIFAITSGSMGLSLPKGSLVFVYPISNYKTHEIITFYGKTKKDIITHRIISSENGQYTTKGDNNNFNDYAKTPKTSIIGKVLFAIPYLGQPILYAKTIPGLIILVIIPATIIIYEELKKIYSLIGHSLKL